MYVELCALENFKHIGALSLSLSHSKILYISAFLRVKIKQRQTHCNNLSAIVIYNLRINKIQTQGYNYCNTMVCVICGVFMALLVTKFAFPFRYW